MVIKKTWLLCLRSFRGLLKRIPNVLSYLFLALSVVICMTILFPTLFDRVPVLSYCINEGELPILYELTGKVEILDENEEIINKNVELFVGGYSLSLKTTEIDLKFSAPMTNEVFVVIRYEVNGKVHECIRCLPVQNGKHFLYEEFIIRE